LQPGRASEIFTPTTLSCGGSRAKRLILVEKFTLALMMLAAGMPTVAAVERFGRARMNGHDEVGRAGALEPDRQAARRKFLRTSGKVAVAAPAAVLLLSATKANAVPPGQIYFDAGPV
jgi:hypothetical protein